MSRNLFPLNGIVFLIGGNDNVIRSAAGHGVKVYTDADGTTPASITDLLGTPISQLTVTAESVLPDFQGPDDASIILYIQVDDAGPLHPIYARLTGTGGIDLNTLDGRYDAIGAAGLAQSAAIAVSESYADGRDTAHVAASNPHTQYALLTGLQSETSARQAADGTFTSQLVAKADLIGGKVPTSQLPVINIVRTRVVLDQAAMLALTDVVANEDLVILDSGGGYLYAGGPPSNIGSWVPIGFIDGVLSVNGQTGPNVVLGPSDVGADAAGAATAAQTAAVSTAEGYTDSALNTHVSATDPHGDRNFAVPKPGAGVDGKPTKWNNSTKQLEDATGTLDTRNDGRYDALGAAAAAQSAATTAAATDASNKALLLYGRDGASFIADDSEITAVIQSNIDSFTSWLNAQPVLGMFGEVGVPHNYQAKDVFAPNEVVNVALGSNESPVHDSGRWASALEYFMTACDLAVVNALSYQGMPVIAWDSRESAQQGLALYGLDPRLSAPGPVAYVYPPGKVLENHITNAQLLGQGPSRGVAMSSGTSGFTETFQLTRNLDTTTGYQTGGALGSEYSYGRTASWQFYASRGVRLIRLTFRAERLFDLSTNTLRSSEITRLDAALTDAKANGVNVILDMHQGASIYTNDGVIVGGVPKLSRHSMGQADGPGGTVYFSSPLFAGMWTKLANHYAGVTVDGIAGRADLRGVTGGVIGYELMNEPVFYAPGSTAALTDQSSANTWQNYSNTAAQAIRAIDATAMVLVHAYGGGTAASSFWTYHTNVGNVPQPWIYASGSSGAFMSGVWYIAHTYFDAIGSGVYPDRWETTRSARAAQGWVPRARTRMVSALAVPFGASNVIYPTSRVLNNNTMTSNIYTVPPNKVTVISGLSWSSGSSSGTLKVYARPASQNNAGSAANVCWQRWQAAVAATSGSTGFGPGPTFLGPGDTLDALATVAGVTLAYQVHEMAQGNLKVASTVAWALANGNVTPVSSPPWNLGGGAAIVPGIPLYQANTIVPTQANNIYRKARVVNTGAPFSTIGSGWAAFNANTTTTNNCTMKIVKNGAVPTGSPSTYPAISFGGALATAALTASAGPAGVVPGAPCPMQQAYIDVLDTIVVSPDQTGMNVWVLIEEMG